jgi:hypothetical protein
MKTNPRDAWQALAAADDAVADVQVGVIAHHFAGIKSL